MSEYLRDACDLFRSRNAGAFTLTFDIVLETDELFRRVRDANVIERSDIGRRLGVDPADVRIIAYEQGRAIKITVPRSPSGGAPDDHDVDGAQQFVALADLRMPG
jgi:uncharacterized protein DUF4387